MPNNPIARTRRIAVLAALCTVLIIPATAGDPAGTAETKQQGPNVVLILVDTLRPDHLPFYGYELDTAPFLSKLAARGAVFERAYSTSSKTAPAAASLFSSLYPEHHGVVLGRAIFMKLHEAIDPEITLNRIPEKVETIGELMKQAGYRTFGVSDNYNVSEKMGSAQGFDRFESDDDWYKGEDYVNGVLRKWAPEILKGGSYFLYVHYMAPHKPYNDRAPWIDAYRVRLEGTEPGTYRAPHLNSLPEIRENLPRYDSEINYVDAKIEEMYRLFGWDRNTLLIFTSDHGEEFKEHCCEGHGNTLFEEAIRIPLFLQDTAGRIPAARVSANVSILDILPTLRDYLGLDPRWHHQGTSLLPLIKDTRGTGRPERRLFSHLRSNPENYDSHWNEKYSTVQSIVEGRWKLVVDSRSKPKLFDLTEDPGEKKNLFRTRAEIAARLMQELETFSERAALFRAESFKDKLSPEEIEKLKSLGYVN